MFYRLQLFSTLAILLTGCGSVKQFSRTGDKAYCLVNYQTHTTDCSYESMKDCTQNYNKHDHELVHCFRKRDLEKKTLNKTEGEDEDGNDERSDSEKYN